MARSTNHHQSSRAAGHEPAKARRADGFAATNGVPNAPASIALPDQITTDRI
jgi:hypothetical protein